MLSGPLASRSCSRIGSVALAVSSALVIAVAGVFDVLAGQRPVHTLTLLVVAGSVGVVRGLLRGRLRGLFTLVNLAVVAQPVAHGVGKLTQTTAGLLPHSHVVPEHLVALSVQVLVALLVVVVAGSEPIVMFVASGALAVAAALSRALPTTTASPRLLERADTDVPAARTDLVVRCRPRRGPPAPVGFIG